ncbi:Golgi transport complex subunit 4 [Lecanora helva]
MAVANGLDGEDIADRLYEGAGVSLTYSADSVGDIQSSLVRLAEQEASITSRLNQLIASQKDLNRELGRLDLMRAQVGSQAVAIRSISNGILSNAASTATRVSGAVKRLDLEQVRVRSTLEVVEKVAELKACVLGVTGSMGAPQDWETAAGYLNRAFKIPGEVVHGAFAEEIVPTAEVPDPPTVTLDHAAESLRGLFLREFEKAAEEGNGGKVTRFFKLFPLIGKPEVGLDAYSRYVCQGVASRARANLNTGTGGAQRSEGFFYANALTKLFEHIAQIIEHHGGLVERHYGAGRMIKVIERLQLEADIQGGIVLDTWTDERSIDRRLTDIKSYAFTFLVQSFLPAQQTRSGTPRPGSPAKQGSIATTNLQSRDEENIDVKEIDGILSELAVMVGRWSLYSSFIVAKCKDPFSNEEDKSSGLVVPPLITNSSLNRKIADRLVTPYNLMTTFYFRRSVERAFQLDEQPAELSLNPKLPFHSNPPYITSAVDDVMYIVNQIVERSLFTSHKAIVAGVLPTLARVLGSDFIGMIQRKMRDESYPKATIQGAPPAEQTIIAFMILINNLDVASDYVKRIVQSRIEPNLSANSANTDENHASRGLITLFPLDRDAQFVANALKTLQSTFEGKSSELINDGIFVVFKNVLKPRLRPILGDAFRDVDYQISKEELEDLQKEAEAQDGENGLPDNVVQYHFQRGWDLLTKPVIRLLTDRNFERLLSTMLSYLGEVLEKRIWSYYGRLDDLGAVRLERDIASIVSIVVKGGRYGLRDAFSRCTQICMIMNMEADEWEDLQIASKEAQHEGVEWKISDEERMRARGMVKDRQ